MSPENVLPDDVDRLGIDGVSVRKGTVAAFVANARQLDLMDPSSAEHAAVVGQMRELVPAMRAVGLFDIFEPVSERVRAVIAGV